VPQPVEEVVRNTCTDHTRRHRRPKGRCESAAVPGEEEEHHVVHLLMAGWAPAGVEEAVLHEAQ
jgi:hypothetical protein